MHNFGGLLSIRSRSREEGSLHYFFKGESKCQMSSQEHIHPTTNQGSPQYY
jgi:hypothetical protein